MTSAVVQARAWARTRQATLTFRLVHYAWWGLSLGLGVAAWRLGAAARPAIDDAHAYWAASLADPYRVTAMFAPDAYHYGPPFLWLISPLKVLPYDLFREVWAGLILLALLWLVGRDLFLPALFLAPFAADYLEGNIHTLMAVAIVLSLRWPMLWVFRSSPRLRAGSGCWWFVFRREWRNLALAVGGCAVVFGVSFVFVPDQWLSWFGYLAELARRPTGFVAVPCAAGRHRGRGPVGRGPDYRRWFVPLAAMIVLPLWPFTLALSGGAVRLWQDDRRASKRSHALTAATAEAALP